MASLIRYGTLSALCLLISSLSAKAGMFPLMAVAHAAAHPSGPSTDLVPCEPDHHAAAQGSSHRGFDLEIDTVDWSIPFLHEPSAGAPSPAPVWLSTVSHKRATPFDLRS